MEFSVLNCAGNGLFVKLRNIPMNPTDARREWRALKSPVRMTAKEKPHFSTVRFLVQSFLCERSLTTEPERTER